MIQVILLGYGNVGSHLLQELVFRENVKVVQVYNRSPFELPKEMQNIETTQNLSDLKEADVYITSISDDTISEFTEKLPFQNRLVVHTSGAVSMDVLSNKNRKGVFYPLQTFSKNQEVDFKNIPVCIEAENPQDLKILKALGELISDKVVKINSEQRATIHVAAVFVNNFTNYLYQIGADILSEKDIPFEILIPLIQETGKKIERLSPEMAQTGPAKRNDQKTIEKHLKMIQNESYKELYALITKQLQAYHKPKNHEL